MLSEVCQFLIALEGLSIHKQLLRKDGIDKVIASIDLGTNIIDDHIWNRKKVRFRVQKIGDTSVIFFGRRR